VDDDGQNEEQFMIREHAWRIAQPLVPSFLLKVLHRDHVRRAHQRPFSSAFAFTYLRWIKRIRNVREGTDVISMFLQCKRYAVCSLSLGSILHH
jgi:hypothetical protein